MYVVVVKLKDSFLKVIAYASVRIYMNIFLIVRMYVSCMYLRLHTYLSITLCREKNTCICMYACITGMYVCIYVCMYE